MLRGELHGCPFASQHPDKVYSSRLKSQAYFGHGELEYQNSNGASGVQTRYMAARLRVRLLLLSLAGIRPLIEFPWLLHAIPRC